MLAAVCIAGWALYSTWVKNEQRIADLQVLELQLSTSLRSNVKVDLQVSQIHKNDHGSIISVKAVLENEGNEDVRVTLDDASMQIVEVAFESAQAVFGKPHSFGNSRFSGTDKSVYPFIDVGPGQQYQIVFVTNVKNPGVYILRFLSEMESSSVQSNLLKNFGHGTLVSYSAGADDLIYIK